MDGKTAADAGTDTRTDAGAPLNLTFETAQKDRQRIALLRVNGRSDSLLLADETGSVSVNKMFFELGDMRTW